MKKIFAILLTVCAIEIFGVSHDARAYINKSVAVIRVMDKTAGKTHMLRVPVDQVVNFEKLAVFARACKQSDPFDAENFYAFLEISKSDGTKIFSNWMDRNEPGRMPLQNADYDVWLVKCE